MGKINLNYSVKPYILTGGPGVGKTLTSIGLELKGYYVIPEVAESYIRFHQHIGNSKPWQDPMFEDTILRYQLKKEEILNQIKNINPVFIDRGNVDALAYYQYYNRPISDLMNQVVSEHKKNHLYQKIFLLEQLNIDIKTPIRKETIDEAKSLELLQEQNYKNLGYEVIRIPAMDLEKRIDLIISNIND